MKRRDFAIGLCATSLVGPAWAGGDGPDLSTGRGRVHIRLTPDISNYRIRAVVLVGEDRIGMRFELSGNYRYRPDNRVSLLGETLPSLFDQAQSGDRLSWVHVDDHVLYAQPRRTIRPELHNLLIGDSRIAFAIGGLTRLKSRAVSPVPGLGDLPVVGGLFRTAGQTDGKQNLIIMVTPRILQTD